MNVFRLLKCYVRKMLFGKGLPIDKFINQGILKVGERTDVSALSIKLFEESSSNNVEIGDDCIILGNIILYQCTSKVRIADRVYIGPNTSIYCFDQVEIESDVMISWNCTLIDTNAHSTESSRRSNDVLDWKKGASQKDWSAVLFAPIRIGRKSWIGFNSIILKGVILGEGSVVAAGSVVVKDSDPYTIIGGNPAGFIRKTS